MTAPVVHRTCEIETSRVPGVIGGVERGERPVVVAIVAGIDERELDAVAVAQRVQRPDAAGVLVRGRHDAAARAPVGEERRGVHRVGRRMGQADGADVGPEDRRHAGPRLVHAGERLEEVVGVGAAEIALVVRDVGHRGGGLGRHRADRSGVQVDPGRQRGECLADRGQLLRIGHERRDHAGMIPTMTGLARPEILATTEWLGENLGKVGIKVLDLRWRPDGSAPAVHAAGHIPGAALVDWRADLIDEGESGEAIVLTSPDRMALLAARRAITDDTTVVVYDDTQSLFAARAWWSLRAYGLDSVRILDGGYPDWAAEGREVSNARVPPGRAGFTVRGPNRTRLTTSDVRGLLGSPGRDPARRPGARRVPRASRATPSGSGTSRARPTCRSGRPASPAASGSATGRRCGTCCTRPTWFAAAGWCATTARGSRPRSWRSC